MLENIIQYFDTIPSLHRALILAGGISFFWIIESALPLFQFKYNKTKMDKTGEFIQDKNVYSNPLAGQGHLCFFTALGVYLSLHQEHLAETEKLFLTPGAQLGNAAQTFARQVGEIAKRNYEMVRHYRRCSHFNIQGLCKGGGTHATSATTLPPQFTTNACHGTWLMGKI